MLRPWRRFFFNRRPFDQPRRAARAGSCTLKHTLNMPRNCALTGDRNWSPGTETAGGGQSGVRLAASYPGHKCGGLTSVYACTVCLRVRAHRAPERRQHLTPARDLPCVCDPPGAREQERERVPTKRSRGANAATTPCARASNRPKHNHSKIATDLFKVWFYANLRHPFPSDEVKAEFADRTGDRQAYRQQTPPRANARVADVFLQSVKGAPCCRCACSGLPHRLLYTFLHADMIKQG